MKITDRLIDAWCREYAEANPSPYGFYFAEYLSMLFFRTQKSGDIIRYLESTDPIDEVYLEAATNECAARANVPIEELEGSEEEYLAAWDKIVKTLRKRRPKSD